MAPVSLHLSSELGLSLGLGNIIDNAQRQYYIPPRLRFNTLKIKKTGILDPCFTPSFSQKRLFQHL